MSDEQTSSRRVEALRQKLEQYNAGIAKAMNDLAHAAGNQSSGGTTVHLDTNGPRLVPPAFISRPSPLPNDPRPSSLPRPPVERSLGGEFMDADRGASLPSQQYKVEVEDKDDDQFDDDVDVDEEEDDDDSDAFHRMDEPPLPPDSDDEDEEEDEEDDDDDHPKRQSPEVAHPRYTFDDLETAYHRVNGVLEAAKVLASLSQGTSFAPVHSDRLAALHTERAALLTRDADLRSERQLQSTVRVKDLEAQESDYNATIKHLLVECDAAKKCFSAIYERKSVIYAKERQLGQLTDEMEKLHHLTQSRRSTLAVLESRLEQRKRALAKRNETFLINVRQQKQKEEELRGRVEKVETLSNKINAWLRILEARDSDLSAKEQRLLTVQQDIQRRLAEVSRRRSNR